MGKLSVAVVCSSNMNRSMEGHSVLVKKNFKTKSFGTGDRIKIPGRSMKEPNVYPFGKIVFERILEIGLQIFSYKSLEYEMFIQINIFYLYVFFFLLMITGSKEGPLCGELLWDGLLCGKLI